MEYFRMMRTWIGEKWDDLDKTPDWLIQKEEWGGRPAKEDDEVADILLEWPVDYVIIHTNRMVDDPGEDSEKIKETIREIQEIDMDDFHFIDIGYNFVIGQDGLIYEGRGWEKMGMHTMDYNLNSIGIAFLGDFEEKPPNDKMVSVTMKLIEEGMRKGYLAEDVQVVTHGQLVKDEVVTCPAKRLKEEVEEKKIFVPDVYWSEYSWVYDLKRWIEKVPDRLRKYKEEKIKEIKLTWDMSVTKQSIMYMWNN